jgi:hypothetical protein
MIKKLSLNKADKENDGAGNVPYALEAEASF